MSLLPTLCVAPLAKVMQRFWRSVCAGDLCLKLSCSRVRLSSAHLLNVGRSTAIAKMFGPSDACFKLIDRHPADGDILHDSSPSFRDVLYHPIYHQPLRQVRRRSAVPMVSQAAPIALLGPTDVGYSTRSPVREQMDATLIRCVYGPAPKIDLLLGRGRLEQMGRAWSRRAPPLWTHLLERHCPRVSEEFVQIASHALSLEWTGHQGGGSRLLMATNRRFRQQMALWMPSPALNGWGLLVGWHPQWRLQSWWWGSSCCGACASPQSDARWTA